MPGTLWPARFRRAMRITQHNAARAPWNAFSRNNYPEQPPSACTLRGATTRGRNILMGDGTLDAGRWWVCGCAGGLLDEPDAPNSLTRGRCIWADEHNVIANRRCLSMAIFWVLALRGLDGRQTANSANSKQKTHDLAVQAGLGLGMVRYLPWHM